MKLPVSLAAPLSVTVVGEALAEEPVPEPDGTTTDVTVVAGEPVVDRLLLAVGIPLSDVMVEVMVSATLPVELEPEVPEAEAEAEAEVTVLVTVAVPEPEAEELDEAPLPSMAKGNEYWKIVSSESHWIFRPYVASAPRSEAIFQSYSPALLSIELATGSRSSRVFSVLPPIKMMVAVPLYLSTVSQVIL